tara:strand:- start:2128 stop:3567 length:1440 start_codon:yes stop_codon:yes gene_type:complete
MPVIPFPVGVEGIEHLPHTRRSLTNCFNNGAGQILSRPGIDRLNTTGKVARGQFVWSGSLYQVVSQTLIKVRTDGSFSDVGAITGNANIVTAVGFNHAVILVPGGDIFTLDAADTITLISGNANFVPSDSVAHINGRFVYIPTDGDPAYFSDVGAAGTVQGVSFFDAEELPDKNEVTFNLNNTLYIGGTDSFELFRDTGSAPNPFQRLSGARISAGYIGGLIAFDQTFFFIGRLKDQSFGIFGIAQGNAPKLSNEPIDLILSEYTESELATSVTNRFVWRGYDIVTFTLKRHSFGLFNGQWFFLDTLIDNKPAPWKGGFITQFGGTYFTASEGNIGKLVRGNQDYGNPISKIIDFGFEQADGDYFSCQELGMSISQGYTSGGIGGIIGGGFSTGFSNGFNKSTEISYPKERTVGLFMSRDNVLYGNGVYRNIGHIGEYSQILEWNLPGGLGSYQGFMGFRIYTTQDVEFNTDRINASFR